jgi:hypothetical protein
MYVLLKDMRLFTPVDDGWKRKCRTCGKITYYKDGESRQYGITDIKPIYVYLHNDHFAWSVNCSETACSKPCSLCNEPCIHPKTLDAATNIRFENPVYTADFSTATAAVEKLVCGYAQDYN